MIKHIMSLLLMASVVMSCNQKEKQEEKEVADHDPMSHEHAGDPRTAEIMAIHDSIMPRMDDLMIMKTKVGKEIKSLDSLLSKKTDSKLDSRKKKATEISQKLEKADHEMMGWMHQYKADTLKSMTAEQATTYLKDQKTKIEEVKKVMETSLEDAIHFIEKKETDYRNN